MLMNDSNFHFTQIPDKTNDVIFLKSPETLFLRHFWSFLSDFFPKKSGSVTQNYIWAPKLWKEQTPSCSIAEAFWAVF